MTKQEAIEAKELLKVFRKGLDSLSEFELIGALDLAIEALGKDTNVPSNDTISRKQAIDVATSDGAYGYISAEELAKLPPTQPSLVKESGDVVKDLVNDCISRQAAIDAYGDWYVEEGTEDGFIGTVKQLLEGLPSAQPERKKGTYTVSGENAEWYCWYATCNECGKEWMGSRNFCPHCGCKM